MRCRFNWKSIKWGCCDLTGMLFNWVCSFTFLSCRMYMKVQLMLWWYVYIFPKFVLYICRFCIFDIIQQGQIRMFLCQRDCRYISMFQVHLQHFQTQFKRGFMGFSGGYCSNGFLIGPLSMEYIMLSCFVVFKFFVIL